MTVTTRRTLLRGAALAVAVAPLLVAPEVFAAASTRKDLYARARFRPLRRRVFRMEGDGRHWRVRLGAIGNLPGAGRRDQHAFSLTFATLGGRGPEQGSYVFRRAGFKPTTLFVVPSDDRRIYQAVVFRKPA